MHQTKPNFSRNLFFPCVYLLGEQHILQGSRLNLYQTAPFNLADEKSRKSIGAHLVVQVVSI